MLPALKAWQGQRSESHPSLAFRLADPQALRSRAIEEATRKARAEAEVMARALRAEIVAVQVANLGPDSGLSRAADPRIQYQDLTAAAEADLPPLPPEVTASAEVMLEVAIRTP